MRITGRAGPHRLRMDPCRVWGHRGEGSPSAWKRQPTPVDAISECWSGAWWAARSARLAGLGVVRCIRFAAHRELRVPRSVAQRLASTARDVAHP